MMRMTPHSFQAQSQQQEAKRMMSSDDDDGPLSECIIVNFCSNIDIYHQPIVLEYLLFEIL